jgi:hypothetical protein
MENKKFTLWLHHLHLGKNMCNVLEMFHGNVLSIICIEDFHGNMQLYLSIIQQGASQVQFT